MEAGTQHAVFVSTLSVITLNSKLFACSARSKARSARIKCSSVPFKIFGKKAFHKAQAIWNQSPSFGRWYVIGMVSLKNFNTFLAQLFTRLNYPTKHSDDSRLICLFASKWFWSFICWFICFLLSCLRLFLLYTFILFILYLWSFSGFLFCNTLGIKPL